MKYSFIEKSIKDLHGLIESNKIDLNPSYQRNFIWSPTDQKDLIDTILLKYPLPNFFIYKKPDGNYEMVDGQQRSKTIYRFVTGQITSSKKTGTKKFDELSANEILDYRLPIVLIEELSSGESLKDFYVLINKKGVHLNTPEVNKSEFHDTNFLKLANEILEYQKLIDLDLFSIAAAKRMNDRAFIEELIGYLHLGLKDKKSSVKEIYTKEDLSEEEFLLLKTKFTSIIDIIHGFNTFRPISKTRYKQKNDFYTLFNFLDENLDSDFNLLLYQYKVLIVLDGEDNDGRQFIRPTNDKCKAFQDYAYHCVTQSNSKDARNARLKFFNAMLKNVDVNTNEIMIDVLNYFYAEMDISIKCKKVDVYELIDVMTFHL